VPKSQTPIEQVQSLLDDLHDNSVQALEITGGGEPCCHPDIVQIMELSLDRFHTALVTNGTRLRKIPDGILERLAWIRISVDAATPETYQMLRRCPRSDWEKVQQSVKRAAGLLGGRCSISFLPYPQNYLEMPAFASLMSSLGASVVRFSPLLDTCIYEGIESDLLEKTKQAVGDAASLDLTVHSQMEQRLSRDLNSAPSRCYYCLAALFVSASLDVSRCCHVAYGRGAVLGNLATTALNQIVESVHTMKDVFIPTQHCRGCPYLDRVQAVDLMMSMDERDIVFA